MPRPELRSQTHESKAKALCLHHGLPLSVFFRPYSVSELSVKDKKDSNSTNPSPSLEILILQVRDGAHECAFLTCSWEMLMLLVFKPQCENHWFALTSDFNDGEAKTQSS